MWQIVLPGLSDILQILILAVGIYYLLLFFRGTRSAQMFLGLATLVASLILLTHVFNLDVLGWILRTLSVYLAVVLVIIFHPEIRRALAELGRPVLTGSTERRPVVDRLVQAVERMANQRIGALIAVQREIGLRGYEETGTVLDAPVVSEMLVSIFTPRTPLHDGGVIIRNDVVAAAGCVFPLSNRADLHKTLGTRHRAAIGLSEETDAVVVVVSEETGAVSLAYRGRLFRGIEIERLRRYLNRLVGVVEDSRSKRRRPRVVRAVEGSAS